MWTVVALAVALLTSGCAAQTVTADRAPIAERTLQVTTTTTMITDAVRRIGGDRVQVTGLMGPGVDPHLFKASARDVRTFRNADVVFYGGLGLEGKMGDLLAQLAARQPTTAVTDGIPREALLTHAGSPEPDPHIWFDVALWEDCVRTIAERLEGLDPTHAAVYRANLADYLAELTALDGEVRARIAAIPADRRLLVTSHDAFAYFGRRYGIEVAAIQGISTAAEATTADVERVAALLAERRVPAAFIETSVPRQTVDALLAATAQRGFTTRVGGELYTDSGGAEGTPEGTYVGMVRANAEMIASALGAVAQER
ncbi:metal ABC transporter solute-binding protein, Zn/Mn family [Pseudonocardia pini]|uniref:metal ABC transporter solute-binding protein, Zn/Mn family n=1 Tax=Pseudonocardia pini TaxID=2758030 RepID=UPI0028B1B6F7|nr:zinc ABC transporter substrate-binding protein [Pseudonocardia pini]